MKHTLIFILASITSLQAQITISEILFEQPSWGSNLQYIELLNYSEETVNISEWSISGDITLSALQDFDLEPGGNYLITSDILAILDYIQVTFIGQWAPSEQISENPFLLLRDPNGQEMARIEYDQAMNWPVPSSGFSIEFCDPTSNINDGLNWALSDNSIFSGGNELVGTPSEGNSCSEINTSSRDFDQSKEIAFYPNPCKSILNLIGMEMFESIIVYNTSGKELLKESNSNSIDISSLNHGIYTAYITYEGNRVLKRFVKL